jgi:general stress protein 26
MTITQLRKTCIERMNTADVVYLTTVGADGYPRSRAMLNLRNREQYPGQVRLYAEHDEDFMVLVSTNTGSRKRGEIEANPRIGLYYCHPKEFFGLLLIGNVEIVDDPALKQAVWADGWEQYFPTGKPDDPDFTLLRLFPMQASGWNRNETFAFPIAA